MYITVNFTREDGVVALLQQTERGGGDGGHAAAEHCTLLCAWDAARMRGSNAAWGGCWRAGGGETFESGDALGDDDLVGERVVAGVTAVRGGGGGDDGMPEEQSRGDFAQLTGSRETRCCRGEHRSAL
jgi:hypothetical protein